VAPGEAGLHRRDRHVAAAAAGDREDARELAGELFVEEVEPVLEAARHVAVVLGRAEDEAVGPRGVAADRLHGRQIVLAAVAVDHHREHELVQRDDLDGGPGGPGGLGGEADDGADAALEAAGTADDRDLGAAARGHGASIADGRTLLYT